MKQKFTVILGEINFYEESQDDVTKAVVYNVQGILNLNTTQEEAEEIAESLIKKEYPSYVIPELYGFPIEYANANLLDLIDQISKL
ncbi:MAG TPA: hypothetical protein VK172_10505 [Lentimicrobium sp.]|nr:hypothetical protein [Lentimicrobium sp.]